jgi:hypothetical protein
LIHELLLFVKWLGAELRVVRREGDVPERVDEARMQFERRLPVWFEPLILDLRKLFA